MWMRSTRLPTLCHKQPEKGFFIFPLFSWVGSNIDIDLCVWYKSINGVFGRL